MPALEDYAWRLWDYWERRLDPDLFVDRTLRGRVAGHVVLITGGSSGIGLAAATEACGGRRQSPSLRRAIPRSSRPPNRKRTAADFRSVPRVADITDPSQCDALVKWIDAEHGGVDILVNNAGRSIRRGIESSFDRLHDFERTMQINYFGALRLTHGACCPGWSRSEAAM